jgi:succinyl-diaminopimelate desuccinylase
MTDEQIKARAQEFIAQEWEHIVSDIDALVRIDSVEDMDHATQDMPYGPAAFEALDTAVQIAARLGLDAHNCDGHIGYADVHGASARHIAMIGHTDIVPVGTGWTFPPLQVTRKDGYLIGGVFLMIKGRLSCRFSAKFFKDLLSLMVKLCPIPFRCNHRH